MEIKIYKTDTGNRDLPTESYALSTPFIEVLHRAVQLNAPLIIKTSRIDDTRSGAWYIKGYNTHHSYEDIKKMIKNNIKEKKYSSRICYLIKHF